jgi:hypothetical protein
MLLNDFCPDIVFDRLRDGILVLFEAAGKRTNSPSTPRVAMISSSGISSKGEIVLGSFASM